MIAHIAGELNELICGVSHGRDNDNHIVARSAGVHDSTGDISNSPRVGYRRSTVFLDDQGHRPLECTGGPSRHINAGNDDL